MTAAKAVVRVTPKGERWKWQVYEDGQLFASGERATGIEAWGEACHYADPIFRDHEIMRCWVMAGGNR